MVGRVQVLSIWSMHNNCDSQAFLILIEPGIAAMEDTTRSILLKLLSAMARFRLVSAAIRLRKLDFSLLSAQILSLLLYHVVENCLLNSAVM